jgi:hypothetical protein
MVERAAPLHEDRAATRRKLVIAVAAVTLAALVVVVILRSRGAADEAQVPAGRESGVAPAISDPAITTEAAPQIRDGIAPLPTDAVGRSPPEKQKQ